MHDVQWSNTWTWVFLSPKNVLILVKKNRTKKQIGNHDFLRKKNISPSTNLGEAKKTVCWTSEEEDFLQSRKSLQKKSRSASSRKESFRRGSIPVLDTSFFMTHISLKNQKKISSTVSSTWFQLLTFRTVIHHFLGNPYNGNINPLVKLFGCWLQKPAGLGPRTICATKITLETVYLACSLSPFAHLGMSVSSGVPNRDLCV